jgi:tryptophan synthase alpha chain
MNRIKITIKKLQNIGKKALVGYFMGGEFGVTKTVEIMNAGVQAGIDILELGFPFADPTADGATIQESSKKALENGTKLTDIFFIVEEFRKHNANTPIILMGYFNIIFQCGVERFLQKCKKAGIDGLIIVDLPMEESQEFEEITQKYNILLIQIVSFLTNKERFNQIQDHAKGFIYLVSTLGVTGQTKPMVGRIMEYISTMQPKLPIFVGFGISSPQSAKEISQYCDGIIVGSHFIKTIRDGGINKMVKSVKKIKEAL